MKISIFDIFKIGIGPSSSHTMGPMKAAKFFLDEIDKKLKKLKEVEKIHVDLYGSLALTKEGHGTGLAIELGLEGYTSLTVNPDEVFNIKKKIESEKKINLLGKKEVPFFYGKTIECHYDEELDYHPNGMTFSAFDKDGKVIFKSNYYSVGGGFIMSQKDVDLEQSNQDKSLFVKMRVPHYFKKFEDLTEVCNRESKNIAQVILENEMTWRPEARIDEKIWDIIKIMHDCVQNGLKREGNIKGGLRLKRRAPKLHANLLKVKEAGREDHLAAMDWISLYGLAASEENATYGRVITAPTNGAAGVIPAVLEYFREYYPEQATFASMRAFILTAGAVGILCKSLACISGAEGGCQAEIGSACAMAAAGLTAALGGTNAQVENAAIIALMHNLGLTCDPVAGLVQVPCIERNAINAVKAVNASRIALRESKSEFATLDQVIITMKATGDDMLSKYRETAQGGLAIYAANGRKGTINPKLKNFGCNYCNKNCGVL